MSKAPSGGQVSYYLVHVAHPNRGGEPYDAECEDIIHALGMTFEEGCEFKAIWRTAKARLGDPKPGKDPLDAAIYDAEKRIHYAKLGLKQALEAKADQRDWRGAKPGDYRGGDTVGTAVDHKVDPHYQAVRAARSYLSQGS